MSAVAGRLAPIPSPENQIHSGDRHAGPLTYETVLARFGWDRFYLGEPHPPGETVLDQFIARFAGLEELLETLLLKGTIVTTDALNCPRAIAQQIVDQCGDSTPWR